MTPEQQGLMILVIPGFGNGDLESLTGSMGTEIMDGKHTYVFDYTLSDAS